MKNKNELFSIILVFFAGILWGTSGTTQAFAPTAASPLTIGAARLAVGGIALLLLGLATGAIKDKNLIFNKRTFITAAAMATYQITFFAAVLKTGVAMGTVVAIGSSPIFAGILSSIINRELPDRKWLIATTISIIGAIFLVSGSSALAVDPIGILLALISGLCFATNTAASKGLLEKYPTLGVTGVVYFLSALMLSPILFFGNISWIFNIHGAIIVLYLGLFTTALAFILYYYGLTNIKIHTAVTLSLAEPVTAALLGIFVLKEDLSFTSLIGIALVFAGLLSLAIKLPSPRDLLKKLKL